MTCGTLICNTIMTKLFQDLCVICDEQHFITLRTLVNVRNASDRQNLSYRSFDLTVQWFGKQVNLTLKMAPSRAQEMIEYAELKKKIQQSMITQVEQSYVKP